MHLKEKIDRFAVVAAAFDERIGSINSETSWAERRRRNDQLSLLERSFLYPLGLLDRLYIKYVFSTASISSTSPPPLY